MAIPKSYAAFVGTRLAHRGPLVDVLAAIKVGALNDRDAPLLIFENDTGNQVDFDLRGSLNDVLERVTEREAPKGPGRPRLGIESREVSLLPRHWAWLALQPNGASAALRRLIDQTSKRSDPEARLRERRDAAYRVMSALAGHRPAFEEAARALFAGDRARFVTLSAKWPKDIRAHLHWMMGYSANGMDS